MILVGRYASPYVRRTAICMNVLGVAYDRIVVSPITAPEAIRPYNPMGRVPVLVLADGSKIVESLAIIDHLIEVTGEVSLWPRSGAERREIGQIVALISTAVEKAIYASYETIKRPEDKRHQPFVDALHGHIVGGLDLLEAAADRDWMVGGRLTLADIALATGWRALKVLASGVSADDAWPRLARHSARCEALPPFLACQPETA